MKLTIEVTDKSHKHIEMIAAKSANMDLVVCCKHLNEGWGRGNLDDLITCYNDFFLCLPQHKEACLHW